MILFYTLPPPSRLSLFNPPVREYLPGPLLQVDDRRIASKPTLSQRITKKPGHIARTPGRLGTWRSGELGPGRGRRIEHRIPDRALAFEQTRECAPGAPTSCRRGSGASQLVNRPSRTAWPLSLAPRAHVYDFRIDRVKVAVAWRRRACTRIRMPGDFPRRRR